PLGNIRRTHTHKIRPNILARPLPMPTATTTRHCPTTRLHTKTAITTSPRPPTIATIRY
ncbi:hypothetical protein GGF41_006612, partial [Coemansia sp. RSA 2531]